MEGVNGACATGVDPIMHPKGMRRIRMRNGMRMGIGRRSSALMVFQSRAGSLPQAGPWAGGSGMIGRRRMDKQHSMRNCQFLREHSIVWVFRMDLAA